MPDYQSNLSLAEAAKKISQAKRVAIITHAKPDGDAFGSVAALAEVITKLGGQPEAWFIPPVPVVFDDLKGRQSAKLYNPNSDLGDPDLVVVLDTGSWSQVSPMRAALEGLMDRTLIIDHHLAGGMPAKWRYVDAQAAACCEIIAELIDLLQAGGQDQHTTAVDLWTPTVCESLFVGVATDTGWFRFSNTRPETHALAAKLLGLGVDQAGLYHSLEQTARPEKLALQVRALAGLRMLADNRAVVMVLRAEDFIQTGATLEETERFVDMPQSVKTVQVVVLVTEPPPHHHHHRDADAAIIDQPPKDKPITSSQAIRLSFRSKPGPCAVDVSQLAAQFGGGGHARAAGAKVKQPVDEVVTLVSEALTNAVRACVPARD
jgi:phosphoesterase RecJ-like protein